MFINDLFNKKQLNESLRDGEYVTFEVFFNDGTSEVLNFNGDDIDWDRVGARRNKKVVNVKRQGGIQSEPSVAPARPHQFPDDSFARAQRAYDRQIPEGVADDLTEMDKSAPQPGRDGHASHKTYGSRDTTGERGTQHTVKPQKAKDAGKDAEKILNKIKIKEQGVAEGSLKEFGPDGFNGGDDLGNIYAVHPDPQEGELVAIKITDVDEHEFDNLWAALPMPYLNEFGGDLPLWNAEDLKMYPNMKVQRMTFDQYVKLVGNYINSDDMANTTLSKMKRGVAETSDYFRRREREEAVISGKKPARKRAPAQTSDYARRREQEKKTSMSEGVTSPEIKQAYDAIMKTEPKSPERKRAIKHYQQLRADALAKKKDSGVSEGFPYDVDHMPGPVIRNADTITDNVKTKNKADWDRAVDSINARVFDDMAEFRTDSKGETVVGDSAVWAKWDNASQTGWFNAKGRPLKPWPVKESGVAEGSGNWYVRVKDKVLKDKQFNAIPFPSQEAARTKAMEIHNKKHIPLAMIKLTQSWMDAPEQGVAEAGPFSYGAKKPRKGSVRDLAARKRQEQEKGKLPAEPRDHMIGVARVVKDVNENYGRYYCSTDKKWKQRQGPKQTRRVSEARRSESNFDIEDIKRLEQVRDLPTLKTLAMELIARPSERPMKPEKVEWFKSHIENMNSPLKIIKLMYDLLLSGEGHAVIGSRKSMNPNSYRSRFGESTVTNEDIDRYVEELERAGYDLVTESATLCPECGGTAYADRLLAEKQDACYHKVKSRYKVWPSAYASGALVQCRKKGAANWGNKSNK